jgi:uncharacterized protein YyaL (SSP411 family)
MHRTAAVEAAEFVLTRLVDPATGSLLHRYRDGDARFTGGLEDYAFFVAGLLDLFECTFDPRWIRDAIALTQKQIALMGDTAAGGFFDTPADDPSLPIRTKEDYDGAEPSGNAVAAMNLLRLGQLTGDPQWRVQAERTVEILGPRFATIPEIAPQMLCALEWMRSTPQEVVIAGDRDDSRTSALLHELQKRYLPHKVVAVLGKGTTRAELEKLLPYVTAMKAVDGMPTAYVCVNQACQQPTTDPEQLGALLEHR